MLWARHRATESPSWACFPGADPHKVPIDPNGNLTTKTEGADTWTYTWNAENQLTRVTKNTVEQARFSYDPFGRRVEKVASGVTTSYTYDGETILRELRGASVFRYVHGPEVDEPLARDDGGDTPTYYHADGLGSIVKRTNQAGTVVHEYRYDVWGGIDSGAMEPGYAFTGREWYPEVGLHYYRARYYDPRVGRFIGEDPIGLAGGDVNLYAYVRGNPTRFIDPFGLSPKNFPPARTRPCGAEEMSACEAVCASQGKAVESCRVSQTFRIVRLTDRDGAVKILRRWADGPMSCSCEDPEEEPFCRRNPKTCLLAIGVAACVLAASPFPDDFLIPPLIAAVP